MTSLKLARSIVWSAGLLLSMACFAQQQYYSHVFFDNSLTPDRYYFSEGVASAPSTLELVRGKLPVDRSSFRSAPNSLRLKWQSLASGSWEAEVRVCDFLNGDLQFIGDTVSFWAFSPDGIAPAVFPRLLMRDRDGAFSEPVELGRYLKVLPAGRWTKVSIPLNAFIVASTRPLHPLRMTALIFAQGASDGASHLMLLDEISVETAEPRAAAHLPQVQNVTAKGYERHVDVNWTPVDHPGLARYVIYRATDGESFKPVGIQRPGIHRYADWLGKPGVTAQYKVAAEDLTFSEGEMSPAAEASTRQLSDDELLTMVQEASFHYYWEAAHPVSGMTRESIPGDPRLITIGASGFGILAIIVGADRGFITRQQALDRLLLITGFLEKADRFHGVWPHFMYGDTGKCLPLFGVYDNGADLVETSFLMQGLLTARQYFKEDSPKEKDLRHRITALWEGIEWDWFRHAPGGEALYWHWSPQYTWHIHHRLTGWNEVMITYLLAIASPTHPIPPDVFYTGFAGQSPDAVEYRQGWSRSTPGDHYANGQAFEGIKLDVGVGSGGPLFFTHYSFLAFDPHARDKYTNYFENNRNLTLINRAYCIRNPGGFKGYGPDVWGLTAADGPSEYHAYAPDIREDDGTVAPTGALASFPYTPEESMRVLKFDYRQLGDRLWGEFGFRDAFNLSGEWFSGIYIGLNQAPIVDMIENYRTGLLWKNFQADPEIQKMRAAIGFK